MEIEYYWSLILEPGWIQAAIWTIEDKTAHVISTSAPLPWDSEDDLVEAVNAALSSCVQDFPEDATEPTKTVFGVPPSWVTEGQIVKEHLGKIRQICSRLSLTPSGFVVLPEAIAHAVKVDEGAPLTGIILGVGKSMLDVTLFRLGNLVGTVNVGRSVSLVDDVIEGLTRFSTGEHLPSRLLIYDGKEAEIEEARQELIKVDWQERNQEKVKFLHTPQVEVVDAKKKAVSVSLAGASEIGQVEKITFGEDDEETPDLNFTPDEKVDQNIVGDAPVNPEEVGFVLGEDVQKIHPNTEQLSDEPVIERSESVSKAPKIPLVLIKQKMNFILAKLPKIRRKKEVSPYPQHPQSIRPSLPKANLPGMPSRRIPAVVGGLTVFIIVGLIIAWWLLPKAEVSIYVSPRTLEEKISLTIAEEGETNLDDNTIAGTIVKVVASGQKDANATGKKTVGEKAKGKVSIRNGTSNGIKLAAGTVIVGPNDLEFTIDESASVSAAISPSSPGSVSLSATAADIGSQYNIAKGEVMKVSNYPKSDVDAVIEEDFSGGSSRDIVAVSSEDLESLEEDLTAELIEQAQTQIRGQISSESLFIEEAISTNALKTDFNHKVGDETSTINLNMEVEATGITIPRATMNELAQRVLESQVPSGFVFRPEQMEMDFSVDNEDEGVWEIEARLSLFLLPNIDPTEVAAKIAGKTPARAREYLASIPGYSRVEIRIRPPLPGRLGALPRVKSNISVGITADK